MTEAGRRYTALILAAQRGPGDPVAQAGDVSHKCLVPIAGEPMLARVLAALKESSSIGAIYVSIESPKLLETDPILATGLTEETFQVLPSAESPSASVNRALAQVQTPLLVTTADHALLSTEILDAFLAQAEAGSADLAVGLVSAHEVEDCYPQARRTYLRFRDDRYSGANLFALRTPAALTAVNFWRHIEVQRKQPWRLVRAFGLGNLLAYLLGRVTLEDAMKRASKRLGLRVSAVALPFAEAAIDVDKPEDLDLVRRIVELEP